MNLGLIGKSLVHSFSVAYFEAKFQELALKNHHYHNCELAQIEDFPSLAQRRNWSGFNVTIPYKEQIIPFLNSLSAEAQAIGAVNTLVPEADGWRGYNTDYLGFQKAIKEQWPQLKVKKALVLGTGGAAKAVVYALEQWGSEVQLVSRSPKGQEINYQEAGRRIHDFDLVVNTTPLGTYPALEELPPLNLPQQLEEQFFIDLIYNPQESRWLRMAAERGAQTQNGAAMLKWQAEYAWSLWQDARNR
jgi:shikimate dehydrogenase